MCCAGYEYQNAFINGFISQTSVTIGSETVSLWLAAHKIGDSYLKYIKWCFYVGGPTAHAANFSFYCAFGKERA